MSHSVLFICLGNICRSPLAQGICEHHLRAMRGADNVSVDSAGTGAWHVGEPPDPGSVRVAARHGIDISHQRARQLVLADAERFDLLVAMDASNLANTRRTTGRDDVVLLRDFDPLGRGDVPDPWGGGGDGFAEVYHILDRSMPALLASLGLRAG